MLFLDINNSVFSDDNLIPREVLSSLLPDNDLTELVNASKRSKFVFLIENSFGGGSNGRLETFLDCYDHKRFLPINLGLLISYFLLGALFLALAFLPINTLVASAWFFLIAVFTLFEPTKEFFIYYYQRREADKCDGVYLLDIADYWKGRRDIIIQNDRKALTESLEILENKRYGLSFIDITNDNSERLEMLEEVNSQVQEVTSNLKEVDDYILSIDKIVNDLSLRVLPSRDKSKLEAEIEIPRIDVDSYSKGLHSVSDYLKQLDKL